MKVCTQTIQPNKKSTNCKTHRKIICNKKNQQHNLRKWRRSNITALNVKPTLTPALQMQFVKSNLNTYCQLNEHHIQNSKTIHNQCFKPTSTYITIRKYQQRNQPCTTIPTVGVKHPYMKPPTYGMQASNQLAQVASSPQSQNCKCKSTKFALALYARKQPQTTCKSHKTETWHVFTRKTLTKINPRGRVGSSLGKTTREPNTEIAQSPSATLHASIKLINNKQHHTNLKQYMQITPTNYVRKICKNEMQSYTHSHQVTNLPSQRIMESKAIGTTKIPASKLKSTTTPHHNTSYNNPVGKLTLHCKPPTSHIAVHPSQRNSQLGSNLNTPNKPTKTTYDLYQINDYNIKPNKTPASTIAVNVDTQSTESYEHNAQKPKANATNCIKYPNIKRNTYTHSKHPITQQTNYTTYTLVSNHISSQALTTSINNISKSAYHIWFKTQSTCLFNNQNLLQRLSLSNIYKYYYRLVLSNYSQTTQYKSKLTLNPSSFIHLCAKQHLYWLNRTLYTPVQSSVNCSYINIKTGPKLTHNPCSNIRNGHTLTCIRKGTKATLTISAFIQTHHTTNKKKPNNTPSQAASQNNTYMTPTYLKHTSQQNNPPKSSKQTRIHALIQSKSLASTTITSKATNKPMKFINNEYLNSKYGGSSAINTHTSQQLIILWHPYANLQNEIGHLTATYLKTRIKPSSILNQNTSTPNLSIVNRNHTMQQTKVFIKAHASLKAHYTNLIICKITNNYIRH
eukprot:gene2684-1682_t